MAASRAPSAAAAAKGVPRRVRAVSRPCSELERVIRERHQSGSLRPEDALHLFDELLPQARPASVYAFNRILIVIARAPVSSSVRDGPALAVSLFNRIAQVGANKVAPDLCTYGIIICSCCHMGRSDLGFAFVGRLIKDKAGWRQNAITFTNLLRALCADNRTSEAMDIVLRRMPEFGCTPDVFSCNTLLKGLSSCST